MHAKPTADGTAVATTITLATGRKFREAIRARHMALMALSPELPPLDDDDGGES